MAASLSDADAKNETADQSQEHAGSRVLLLTSRDKFLGLVGPGGDARIASGGPDDSTGECSGNSVDNASSPATGADPDNVAVLSPQRDGGSEEVCGTGFGIEDYEEMAGEWTRLPEPSTVVKTGPASY